LGAICSGHDPVFVPHRSPEQKAKLIAECQTADAVVLTYACDRLSTLERLSSYWLPELRRIQVISRSTIALVWVTLVMIR
jgi:hypothetical protein